MESEWPMVSIDSIKAARPGSIAIGPFGSRMKSNCYVDAGVRVIRGTNLNGGRALSGNFVFVTPEKADELGPANLSPQDLVFPHRGAIGEVGIVPDDSERYVLSSSLMKLTCDLGRVHPDFVFYFFKSDLGRFELLKNASQVGTPGIGQPLTSLRQIKLRLPPLKEQQRIAACLRALDDRIALLRETNVILEAIAQALFKSWFVDFDPVRAKSQGLTPSGVDEATLALFPNSFQESALGPVPSGWSIRSLDQIANFLNGLALQKYPPQEDAWLPVIKIAQLRKGDTVGADRAGRNIKPEYIVANGDVLFSWSGSLEVEVWCGGEGALNQHLFKVTSNEFPKWFYFWWTRRHLEHFRQIAATKATTMGHIQRRHLSEAKVLVPPRDLLDAMSSFFEPLLQRIVEGELHAQTLASLRDALLPRLISGELPLSDAGALFETATS